MEKIKDFVLFEELNQDGRYVVGSLGYFKVLPEYFKIHFGYRPTEEGWEYYESIGLKHPGRGWVKCEFYTKEELEEKIISAQKMIKGQLNFVEKLESIIS